MRISRNNGARLVAQVADAAQRVWTPRSSQAWDPSPLRYPSFASTAGRDVYTGTLQRALGIDEPVRIRKAVPCGDQHTYFALTDMEVGDRETRVRLHYPRAQGEPAVQDLRIPPKASDSLRDRYDRLDTAVVDLLQHRKHELFTSATKRVSVRGLYSGRAHTLYYKCGQAVSAEQHGRVLLQHFGLSVPPLTPSSVPGAYWVAETPGETLLDLYTRLARHSQSFKGWTESARSVSGRLAHSLGRAVIAMYVLGNDDFHLENGVIAPDGEGHVVDLETIGLPRLDVSSRLRLPHDYLNAAFEITLSGLFASGIGDARFDASKYFSKSLLSGALEAIDMLRDPARQEALIADAQQNFVARAVIRPTYIYNLGFLLDGYVPHYSFQINGADYAQQVSARIALLYHVADQRPLQGGSRYPDLCFI